MSLASLYWFFIAFGGVLIGVSILFGHSDFDHDADLGHADLDLGHSDLDLGHADLGHVDLHPGHVDLNAGLDADADHGWAFSILPLTSMRFWTFLFEAFGLTGALLQLTRLPQAVIFGLALTMGAVIGYAAYLFFRWLTVDQVSGATDLQQLSASEAEVQLTIRQGALGQVCVPTASGTQVLVARSHDPGALEPGDKVLIISVQDGVAEVTRLRSLPHGRAAESAHRQQSQATIPRAKP